MFSIIRACKLAHLGVVAHLRHDDIAPDAPQLVEIHHEVSYMLVVFVGEQADPVARLDLAADLVVARGVNDVVFHRIAPVVWQEQDGRVVAALTGQSIDGLVACDLQFRLHLDGRVVGCRFVAVASSKQACGQSDCNQCFCTHHRECYFLSAKIVINHKKSIVQAVFCFFLFNFAALVRAAETLTARNKIEENRSSR